MKHSASIWDGEVGNSRCIDVVHWEGDITPEELANVASQISPVWEMVDLQLDQEQKNWVIVNGSLSMNMISLITSAILKPICLVKIRLKQFVRHIRTRNHLDPIVIMFGVFLL